METYKAKGYLYFFYFEEEDGVGLGEYKIELEDLVKQLAKYSPNKIELYRQMKQDELTYKDVDIMSGIEFLQAVQSGSITDYDGFIAHVFVDGYKSNLGLVHNHLMDGEFLVDEKAWLNICKEHKVEIDWANK